MSIVNIFKDRKILLLEDEEPLRRLIQMEFAYNHLQIEALPSFSGIVDYIQKLNPDLIILSLEVKSEESTGLLICEKLRFQGNKAWIIVTSSKSNINEKIAALNAGADDYFAKPFSSDELMAKVKAMLRRSFSVSNEGILEYSDIRMDLINRAVWRNNKLVDLRSKEFDLLKVFGLKTIKVSLEVTHTVEVDRGNSVSDIMKDAELETGLMVKVPAFIIDLYN